MKSQEELLEAMDIIARSYFEKTAQIYNGQIISQNADGTYVVRVNGKEYNIQKYGTFNSNTNTIVKVFVPMNNFSIAFFI